MSKTDFPLEFVAYISTADVLSAFYKLLLAMADKFVPTLFNYFDDWVLKITDLESRFD